MSDEQPSADDTSIERLTDSVQDQLSSRRGFLGGAAAAGAAAIGLSGAAAAQPSTQATGAAPGQAAMQEDEQTDVDILNYALTLEHLEATFYAQGLEEFAADELMTADAVCDRLCMETREQIPEYVAVVGEHEAAHVDQLTTVIEDLGGDPVEPATYDFGYDTPTGFLKTAKALENTGVAAYAGAAPAIENDKLLSAALSIHSVEARHAGTFNWVNGTSPFPNGFDEPKSMAEVKEIASQFIVEE
ncbi:ferritin-like domain-containing protein [Haloarchaeobius amylolyticus]|uniref:ferritin-like domain-containing protein n=1 Tax=Haloarchaeobius amylolyticus TaxID=1198296 RepID=UPI00226D42EC|nr:ferritin-like domain-containing protein [Haloarchaeobius amylolyticus]